MDNHQEERNITAEELFTMEGYEYFKTKMFIPEENRDFYMSAYLGVVASTLLI